MTETESLEEITDAEVVPTQADVTKAARTVIKGVQADARGAEIVPSTAPNAELVATTPVNASDLVERLGTIKEAMDTAMKLGVDYGVIPGTSGKPTLLKPGAEKLGVLFQLDIQTTHEERFGPGDHLTVAAYSTVFHAPTGARLGRGEGLCTTREKKYAYRKQDRICPECQNASVFKSKKEGEGWYCWSKKGGCGAQFSANDERITNQTQGDVDNPALPDMWNVVVKMARKRAIVDAVLLVTGASALFTQDQDDAVVEPEPVIATAPAVPAGPPYGPPASPEQVVNARKAIGYLLGEEPDGNPVGWVLDEIEKAAVPSSGGEPYLPHFALSSVVRVASKVKARREATGPTSAPGPVSETAEPMVGDPSAETSDERVEREEAERLAAEHGDLS